MSQKGRNIRFGLWYDFRNPAQWHQSPDRLYCEILDQIAWGENNGFDDVWLSEHHFIEDGYLPSILPVAAAIAARTAEATHTRRSTSSATRSGPGWRRARCAASAEITPLRL